MKQHILRIWAARHTRLAVATIAVLLIVVLGTAVMLRAQEMPTISIVSVAAGESVTIETKNYPANQTFTVLMGAMGTRGIEGTVVGSLDSGEGGSITATFAIPEALQDAKQVAIRLESSGGYFSYNWFHNATATAGASNEDEAQPQEEPDQTESAEPAYSGVPTFGIMDVESDATVTVKTSNFPPNRDFKVLMGALGTRAEGGIMVATTNSGDGGEFSATFAIPESLYGSRRIAIRMESSGGYYAFNWFYNNTTEDSDGTTKPPVEDPAPLPDDAEVPTFSVQAVARDASVTIMTANLPPNRDFTVTMGAMGTRGVNGVVVATTNSGEGGSQTLTYSIPAELAGTERIAIRLESMDGYFAFNWFYNTSTD